MMLALAITPGRLPAEPGVATGTNVPPRSAGPVFDVRGYLVEGNRSLLPPETIAGVLSNYTGSVEFERLREGLGALQLLYRERGFATVSVVLPRQRLTNGVVRVRIVPGTLSDIVVTGNRYFSSANIRRALPSLTTNVVLNTKWFQPELDRANANADRQIYPVINPGPEPGTSGLTLNVNDQLPLHGHMEVNDKSTPGTPLLRIDSAAQYNNLWQLEHQIGIEYNFSPQSMKSDSYSPNIFDQPMVASYSGFYRLPLDLGQNLRETYNELPVDFGYDQVTHRFNLPPPTGNPGLIVYASRSTSETPTRLGPITLITNTALADISSQFAERDLTFSENLGTKLTIPLREFGGVRSSLLLGFDYKSYEATSFSTNLTYFDLFALDNFGNRVLVTNQTIALADNRRNALHYMPLSIGWTGVRPDKWGSTSFTYNQNVFLAALASPRSDFEAVAGSSAAGGNYTVVTAGLTREEKLFGDWTLVCRAGGQWASAPLISNEQFALGGTSGVRGYQEGENYGDTGWRVLFDLRAPPLNVGYFPTSHDAIPADLRCSWFMDYGETYLIDRPTAADDRIQQWGTGPGFYLTVGQHVDARLTLGWALHDTPTTRAGSLQGYFMVGFQF
jgi:hemolysin activation/secretion protein